MNLEAEHLADDVEFLGAIRERLARSHFKTAAQACGFRFGEPEIGKRHTVYFGAYVEIKMVCICGRVETFQAQLSRPPSGTYCIAPDLIELMYRSGSFDESHLLKDGYPPEFAARTRKTFEIVLESLRLWADSPDWRPSLPREMNMAAMSVSMCFRTR